MRGQSLHTRTIFPVSQGRIESPSPAREQLARSSDDDLTIAGLKRGEPIQKQRPALRLPSIARTSSASIRPTWPPHSQ